MVETTWDLKTIMSLMGTIIAIALNLCPGYNFYQVYKKQAKIETIVQSVLLMNVLCSLLWTGYWWTQDVVIPIVSSGVGEILSVIYAVLYMFFICENLVQAVMYSLTIFNSVFVIFLISVKVGPIYCGPVATVVNIIQYAAPAQNILKVFRTGDYTLIPIVFVLIGFLCSGCWLSFGILQHDFNCIIPNVLGVAFSIINTFSWTYFYLKRPKDDKDKKEQFNQGTELEVQ